MMQPSPGATAEPDRKVQRPTPPRCVFSQGERARPLAGSPRVARSNQEIGDEDILVKMMKRCWYGVTRTWSNQENSPTKDR
jgi:hypothetical protein